MFRRIFLIIFLIVSYVYLVSSDPKGDVLSRAKKFCNYCVVEYKKMNLKYHVNKWPSSSKKRRYY
ncbi:MAG: hypothetical protein KR126chlam6_01337 [Candidatus Anoxychlamydiales bacterium]|nr:hypothetical protein [Candidatus Anoxychlamydiales bacterium]